MGRWMLFILSFLSLSISQVIHLLLSLSLSVWLGGSLSTRGVHFCVLFQEIDGFQGSEK